MSIYFIYEQPELTPEIFLNCSSSGASLPSPVDAVTEFKIGESINPPERLKQLQTGNKRQLVIYQTIFCGTKCEAQQLETTIHERLKAKHIRGEWFKVNKQEVDNLIREIQKLRDVELALAKKRYSNAILFVQ